MEEKSPHRSLQKNWQKKIGEKNVDKIRKKSICEQSKVKHPIAGGEIPPLQSSEDLVETSFCRECDTGSNIGIIRENLPKTFLTDITQITSPPLPPNSGNLYNFFSSKFWHLVFGYLVIRAEPPPPQGKNICKRAMTLGSFPQPILINYIGFTTSGTNRHHFWWQRRNLLWHKNCAQIISAQLFRTFDL